MQAFIKDLRSGDRFVHDGNQKPYIKCDHVIHLADLKTVHTGVSLYTGELTLFKDNEPLTVTEVTVRPKLEVEHG